MEHISIDDAAQSAFRDDIEKRTLTDALNTADVAINHYVVEPGERISGLHTHMDQEEVFIVLSGEATFETLDDEITVGEHEAIRFVPGEFQSSKNDTDNEVVVLALGAPRDSEDTRIPLSCPECGHDNMRPEVTEVGEILICPDCGVETDAACPECGKDNMQAILSEVGEKPVGICRDCGAGSAV